MINYVLIVVWSFFVILNGYDLGWAVADDDYWRFVWKALVISTQLAFLVYNLRQAWRDD